MTHPIVDQLLIPFIVRFFLVFGIIGFAAGVGLILMPVRMHQFFGTMNHWVSMRHSTKWLAVPRDTGPAVLHFQRLIGAVFVIVAAFSTFVLMTQIEGNSVVAALSVEDPHSFVAWIVECTRWLLVVGSMVAIAVGIMLIFFPNALRAIETRSDRWYSFRRHSQNTDAMHMGFDRWIESQPRAMGWIIAVAALVVVVDFAILLFSGG
jgi:hypothetical protein